MARRKDSRIEKIRTEENDLDNQLREAGLFEDGMDFDTKKAMLAMLEESRKSAQEEESQRQQWKEQEEEILKETLNRSFRNNIEESHQGKTGASENQSTTNNEAEQISSSVGTSSKGLSDTGLPTDKKDDSDEEMVPCPLCQNFFPVQKIEVHASDCSDLVDSQETPQPKEVNKKGKRKRLLNKQPAPDTNIDQELEEIKTSDMTTSGEAKSSAGHEKCTFCKKLFKEGDDFLNHVNSCTSMEAIQHNIVSPTTSTSSGFKSVRPKVDADSPIRVVGGSTPVVKTGSLFDRLEESEEEFEIPTSPAQNFIPISQQTDSMIDYHNQFRDKTQKPMTVGANWRGARQRRQRKRKGRSTKGKAAKMKIEIKKEVQK